jgi:transcription initiation factor TFIIIB Brf1 subunit/transcription initiation factor TFIIB
MRQTYFCPNCRGLIVYPDRFCGTCGTGLKWEIQQTEPHFTSPSHKSSADAAVKLHDDISKLLAEFFDRRAKDAIEETHARQ